MNERTWEIADIDGSNRRLVTLDEFYAELDARRKMATPIMNALRRGDKAGVAALQKAMRAKFQ